MGDDVDQTLSAVGPRLRTLRRQRETTLADLSAQTGISVSTLSRLESGDRKPTLELLLPLARAYGVTLDELVDAPPTGDPRVHLRPVERHGMTMIPLTQRAGGIQAYKLVIPAGGRRGHRGRTADPRGVRVDLRAQRPPPARASATTTCSSAPARRPSSTPGSRTGSAPPRKEKPSSSSASSAARASAPTSAPARHAAPRPTSLSPMADRQPRWKTRGCAGEARRSGRYWRHD